MLQPFYEYRKRTDKREVGGSSPLTPIYWVVSSAGRAPALHAGGQEFDPPTIHIKKLWYIGIRVFLRYGALIAL